MTRFVELMSLLKDELDPGYLKGDPYLKFYIDLSCVRALRVCKVDEGPGFSVDQMVVLRAVDWSAADKAVAKIIDSLDEARETAELRLYNLTRHTMKEVMAEAMKSDEDKEKIN